MRPCGWRLEVDIAPQRNTSMSNEFKPAWGAVSGSGISAVVLPAGHALPIPGVTSAIGARGPREGHKNKPQVLLL